MKEVIYINNIEPLPKSQSSNEKTSVKPSTKPPKKPTVTEEEKEKEEEKSKNPEDKNTTYVKDDTELEKLVKSDRYKSFVSKELEE